MFLLPMSAWGAERGEELYDLCSACHGEQGQGKEKIHAPAIAGIDAWYAQRQLKNFQEGIRGAKAKDTAGLLMRPMARTLTNDEDIKAVALYLSSLPTQPGERTMDGDPARGEGLYAPCMGCHGLKAEGNQATNAPSLRNLNDWYLLAQLRKFRSGTRGGDPADAFGAQMRTFAKTLPDEQAMKDVVAYIVSRTE